MHSLLVVLIGGLSSVWGYIGPPYMHIKEFFKFYLQTLFILKSKGVYDPSPDTIQTQKNVIIV